MTREVVLELWLEGGKLATIARLLNEDSDGIEDAIRMELNRIRDEFQPGAAQASAEVPEETPAKARKGAAHSSDRPARRETNHAAALKRSPARNATGRLANG